MSHFLLLLAVTSALCRHGVGQRSHAQNSIKVMISEGCVALGEAADADAGGKELSLSPGAPLVLTHHIRLVPSSPDSGPVSGSCDCVSDLGSLRERVERLERELSALRQKCGDPEANGGCTSRESKGAGCSVSPDPVSPVSLCPSDCSDQGRCVDGKCVCFSGFRGSDCSEETCSPPCGQRGRCMEGQCVCGPGFSGADCSMASCDCGGRGVCVDGQCVCDSGFTGESCAELACPRGCSQRGRCVDGVCVCDSGFSGADCGTGGCSSDCGQRGRCVQGKCVCQSGFTGDECERCGEGYGGKNCDMVMSSVEQLRTIDLTQSSVSVVWTQPRVQYESYGLVFTSQKDGSQVQAQVPGSLSSFRQTGLAPAQTYSITVTGATGDSRGAPSSTSFTTLPAPPSDLRVVKTSSSSAVIQWEPSPSAIDRYRLSVSPGDGTEGRGQDLTFDPGTSSAHITQLRAGLRYDITLVAESGQSHSAPLTTHATPGPTNALVSALTLQRSDSDKLPFENNLRNTKQPESIVPKLNITKVHRRIQVMPLSGGDVSRVLTGKVASGNVLGSNVEINQEEGEAGIDKSILKPKRTCLNRVKVTHGRVSHKVDSSHCSDPEMEIQAEKANETNHGPRQVITQDKNLEVSQDHSVAQPHPLQKLLSDTFNNLNVTTFAIHLSEPSNVNKNAEVVAQQIMQGLKPLSTLKKSVRYSHRPEIMSLERLLNASPTSATQDSAFPNSKTVIEDIDKESFEEKENERQSPTFQRTNPNRKVVRRLRPHLTQIRNMTGLASRTTGVSFTPKSKIKVLSTDTPVDGMEKMSLSRENHKDSEEAELEQAKTQDLPNLGAFHNPNKRLFRRPFRLPQQSIPTYATPNQTNEAPARDNLKFARTSFNRSRIAFMRRPNGYIGPFQNRSRLFLRPPRGHMRKNWTAERLPNQKTVADINIQGSSEDTRSDGDPTFVENDHSMTRQGEELAVSSDREPVSTSDSQHTITMSAKGFDTLETDFGKHNVQMSGNVKKNPQTEQRIIENSGSGNVAEGTLRINSEIVEAAKKIPVKSVEQDESISNQTEEIPDMVDEKQKNTGALESRRRIKPIGNIPQPNQAAIISRNSLVRNADLAKIKPQEIARKEKLSIHHRGQANPTVARQTHLQQFLDNTAPNVRRSDGFLSASSKMDPALTTTSTDQPHLIDENEKYNVDSKKVFENGGPGESQRLDGIFSESDFKVTVLGEGSEVLSRLQKLVISTGPEPPSDLRFSHVTDNSVTVSWTRPQSMVSGFKLTYTHTEEGEPVSVALDQGNSSIDLARLAPGSSYEVSVMSVLGLDESDEISKTLHTLPDPPTDLRAVNVSHTGALLLWRPSLANVEKYTIVYGSGTGSEVRVSVSGNSAQKELSNLQPSTSYSVTISSERRGRESREDRTSFTTTSTSTLTTTESVSLGARNLRASHVTPRTAMLSWKPPSRPVIGYKLTYHTEGHKQEVSLGATVTQLNLTRLIPGEEYTAQLQTEGEEVLSTSFTTGSLRFPFPADCSEEQLNGLSVSGLVDIYPMGRKGAALSVWCDMDTDGGGWTVFQRRQDGSVDFFRSWREYVQGFGEPAGEFWLGLEALHNLTTRGSMMLRVDLRDRQDTVFAQYSTFEVSKRNYRLTVGGYSGTAGDSMSYHSGRIFTTKDRDPASFITRCAMSYRGGWWYKNCHEANLNGLYGTNSKHQGVIWMSWKGKETSIPFTEMKMRPTDYLPNTNNRA